MGPRVRGNDQGKTHAKSSRGTMCPGFCSYRRALEQRGRRENRMPAAPVALCAMFGGKAHKLHSPQGSTDIRFSLHDGLIAAVADSVHHLRPTSVTIRHAPSRGPECKRYYTRTNSKRKN